MTLLEISKKSSANYKHYRKLIQWVSKRSASNKQVSFKNAAAVCKTSDSGEFIFQ